jgi:DUF3072 family protein
MVHETTDFGRAQSSTAVDDTDGRNHRRPRRLASVLLFLRVMKKDDRSAQPSDTQTTQKDPDEWKTGDEPMTPAQRSYLETLARDTGESVDENLSKAEASKLIDRLRQRSPRVQGD